MSRKILSRKYNDYHKKKWFKYKGKQKNKRNGIINDVEDVPLKK